MKFSGMPIALVTQIVRCLQSIRALMSLEKKRKLRGICMGLVGLGALGLGPLGVPPGNCGAALERRLHWLGGIVNAVQTK